MHSSPELLVVPSPLQPLRARPVEHATQSPARKPDVQPSPLQPLRARPVEPATQSPAREPEVQPSPLRRALVTEVLLDSSSSNSSSLTVTHEPGKVGGSTRSSSWSGRFLARPDRRCAHPSKAIIAREKGAARCRELIYRDARLFGQVPESRDKFEGGVGASKIS